MKRILLYFILVSLVYCDSLYIQRNFTCIKHSKDLPNRCNKWNQTMFLFYHKQGHFFYCFPQHTLLQTSNGSKFIEEIQIGDSVLSYNRKSNQSQYSPIIAWISRDVDAVSAFTQIQVEGNATYQLSPFHNIATQNQQNEIQYRFASTTSPKMDLVNLDKQKSRIKQVKTSQQMKGLYAPLTKNSNFYIYPFGMDKQSANKSNLILVHCYSQIHDPVSFQQHITPLLQVSSYFVDQSQPNFVNPFYQNLKYFISDSWKDQTKIIKVELDQFQEIKKENNLRVQSYSISKQEKKVGNPGAAAARKRSEDRKRNRIILTAFMLKNGIHI